MIIHTNTTRRNPYSSNQASIFDGAIALWKRLAHSAFCVAAVSLFCLYLGNRNASLRETVLVGTTKYYADETIINDAVLSCCQPSKPSCSSRRQLWWLRSNSEDIIISKCERQNLVSMLEWLQREVLTTFDIDWMLTGGTLLGAMRGKRHLPDDGRSYGGAHSVNARSRELASRRPMRSG